MDKKFTALIGIFFLSFVLFATIVVFRAPLTTLTRASEELKASSEFSRMIVFPLSLPADGKSEVDIAVFVANLKQKPLPNKVVSITTTLGEFKQQSAVSEGVNAKADFQLTSSVPGTATVTVTLDNSVKLKPVTIEFTEVKK